MTRRVLAAGGVAGEIPDPGPPTGPPVPATRVLNVADWVGGLSEGVVSGTRTAKSAHTARLTASNLRLVFAAGETTTGVLAATVQVNAGPIVAVTWNSGSSTAAFTAMWARKTSDPAAVTVEPGDTITVRARYTGDGSWMNAPTRTGVGNGNVAGDYLTGEWPASGVTAGAPGPLMILGDVVADAPQSWLQSGDSIVTMGFLNTALDGRAWVNLSRFGEQLSGIQGASGVARYGTLPWSYVTRAIVEYGANDLGLYYPLTGSNTAASVLAAYLDNALNHWRRLSNSGIRVWQTTITPMSNSTDGFVTTANQTPKGQEEVRVPANTWFRDGAPLVGSIPAAAGTTDPTAVRAGQTGHPLKGVIEVADAVESARNSGKWKAPGYTSDGVHPDATASTAMAAAVATFIDAL